MTNKYVPRGNRIWKEALLVPICSILQFIEGVGIISIRLGYTVSRKFIIKVRGGSCHFQSCEPVRFDGIFDDLTRIPILAPHRVWCDLSLAKYQ